MIPRVPRGATDDRAQTGPRPRGDEATTPLLIVEDDDLVATAMERWLSALGYPVAQVHTAEEALAVMETWHPGVAICDVGLPGHDGLWLADRLRHDFPDTAVILATGRDGLLPAATLHDGIVSYLLKPFGRDQLRDAVVGAVRWHQNVISSRDAALQLERGARDRRRALRELMQGMRIETEADAVRALEVLFPEPEERQHGVHVAVMADTIADRFRMPECDRPALHWAARFHRLGRLTIPESILRKPEALSRLEMDIVQRAPSEAFELLLDHAFLADAGYLLRSMRERADGLGRPDGLVGTAIPLGSRILAVAEAIEAIMHDQPYRPARSPADAVVELLRSGTQFDADVVHAGVEVIVQR